MERMKTSNLRLILVTIALCTTEGDSNEKNATYLYGKYGDPVVLKCINNTNSTSWDGPSSHSLTGFGNIPYTHDYEIVPGLPNADNLLLVGDSRAGEYNLMILNLTQKEEGYYKCNALRRNLLYEFRYFLRIKEPPNIPDQHIHFKDTDVSRTLQCLAYGIPATYSYGRWQHLSFFGEHIRYLYSSTDGKMTLPPISNTMERYQDNGIYLCTASNSVNDSSGNIFQTGKTFVMSNGPPVLLEKNELVHYVNRAKILNLKFSVYSPSDLECFNVDNSKTEIKTSTQMTSVNRTTILHGVEISVSSVKVVSSFNISDESDQQVYTITLCNAYGNISFVIELTPTVIDVDEMKSKRTKIAVIVILIVLVLCVVISGITIFLTRKRNMKRNVSRATEGSTELAEGFPIPPEKSMRNVKRGETSYSQVWC